MNTTKAIIAAILVITILTGCGKSPKSTAEAFLYHLAAGNVSEAKKLATDQTGRLLDLAFSLGKVESDSDFDYTYIEHSIDGNTATVKFRVSGSESGSFRFGEDGKLEFEEPHAKIRNIDLVKIDGQWKVQMSK